MSDVRFDPEMIKALLDAFDSSDWEEMTLTIGGDSLHVSRNEVSTHLPASGAGTPAAAAAPASPSPPAAAEPAAPAPETNGAVASSEPASAPAPAAPPAASATGNAVESPTVGIFWVAPSPGAPPFVEVGSRVGADEIVGIVEVMKLMNQVPAGVDGVVSAILVGNGEAVEFGQSLILIEPNAGS
jgi:acetyl-CoA carboxylase biotin carboxyl carrier protein